MQYDITIHNNVWGNFLEKKLHQRLAKVKPLLTKSVNNFAEKLQYLSSLLKNRKCKKKSLVHGDYYLNNVLVDETGNILSIKVTNGV